jgi:hypothetical protein
MKHRRVLVVVRFAVLILLELELGQRAKGSDRIPYQVFELNGMISSPLGITLA